MVSINYSSREVCCKIVYYGPGLSGKTTNLLYIHSKVPSNTRGKMISLATEADRTLYFDFLPINIGTINGFAAKFQLYTVPGQVYYNATRKLVLRGVDGVVFVADSQPDKMDENIESLVNLEENLEEYGYNLDELPMVIQFNKCDLPGVMSADEMNAKLNPRGLPTFVASATVGNGVFDTLKMVIKMVLEKAKNTATGQSRASTVMSPNMDHAQPPKEPQQPAQKPAFRETASPEQPASEHAQGSVATAEAPAPADQDTGFRPYPGSNTTKVQVQKQNNVPTENNTAASPTAPASEASPGSVDGESDTLKTPLMAPSVKRRKEKKRGFFKRLFGIK